MQPRLTAVLTTAAAFALLTSSAVADGLIQKLPTDGNWVRFDMTGEGRSPSGDVGVTLKGTLTLRSVGRETVDGAECRWIEIETSIEFQRGGTTTQVGEVLKLLIPEKFLAADQNPRAHVLKAWTWLTDKVAFGAAGFRQSKSRSANGVSQGARTMELKVAESGTGAKSAIEK